MDDRTRLRLEAHGTDVDAAMAVLPGFYDGRQWSIEGEPEQYAYRYAALGGDEMTLRTSRMRGRITGDIPPGDEYVVQWLVSGRGAFEAGGDRTVVAPGRPVLFPHDRAFVFDYADYDQKLVHLDRRVVDRVAVERGVADGVRLGGGAPSERASALWFDTVGLVSRTLQRGGVSDLLWSELTRMTAHAFLELHPPLPAALPEGLLQPRAARLRAAVEFAHAHAEQPIGPAELAEAAGLSVRALQIAFRQVLDTTPHAYLQQVRLDRVHEDLQAGDPSRTSVARVARSWGFANLGRFSAQYQQRFGVYPSATLRSGAPRSSGPLP